MDVKTKTAKKPQLYINMSTQDIPYERLDENGNLSEFQSEEYMAFWQEEERKVREGVTIDGFYISGWLYWHLNHWWINKDKLMPNGDIVPTSGRPDLRDNELIIDDGLIKAQNPENRRHLIILGARQISKTTFEASFLGRSGVIYKGSQNLILSTNSGDLNNITASLDFGLLNCSKYFYVNRITKDWDQERVVLGTETKKRDRVGIWSQYVLRNSSAGNKTEAGAGVTIKSGIYDEIGKEKWLESFKAAEKAMVSRYGIRAVFIAVGTGGSFEKGADAQSAFFSPDTHKFVKYTQPDGRETGLFISGLYRQDCKVKATLGEYLQTEDAKELLGSRIPDFIPEDSELYYTDIHIADKELAFKRIMEDRAAAKQDTNPRLYIKTLAYDPLVVDEIFLTDSHSPFSELYEDMKKHQLDLKENYQPKAVKLYREPDQSVKWDFVDQKPILEFPVNPKSTTEAPVMMLEPPIQNLPYATYVCGIDPYNQDRSSDGAPSLGVCYIFKRMYDSAGAFQNSIVASYAARPRTLTEFYNVCEMMIDMYHALALPENEGSIIQHFISKKKEHVLFDSPALTRYIHPTSATQSRQKGLAATTPNQRHYMKLMFEYFAEEIKENINGREYKRFGLTRIGDPMLIAEALSYRSKSSNAIRGVHDGNFDRICAFGHCLTLANYLDRDFSVLGKMRTGVEPRRQGRVYSAFPIHEHDPDNPSTYSPFSGFKSVF